VTPATIGLVDGVAHVGMTASEIHTLASAGGRPSTMKVSRRDLPYIIGMVIQSNLSPRCVDADSH
jgi:pseudouridine-5'-phosphate glycosidase/pseudouridine kinase